MQATSVAPKAAKAPALDAVDLVLSQSSGQVERPRGPMCRHAAKQRCGHCLPVDPFDEEYLKEKDIKHLSFYAYVRKMTNARAHGKGSRLTYPIENIRCHVLPNCPDHKPYPKGICTKCRPATVTLQRQAFRHVDNIAFENARFVERFLDYWKRSGQQRAGVLVGKYEPHPDVPLGIRAVVHAIYEPPQTTNSDMIDLQWPDEDAAYETLEKLCELMDLKPVGWIFTDLVPIPGTDKVECTRNADSYLMSSEECIMAARLQNRHANACRLTEDNRFGSKFVTVVVTGDAQQGVAFSGYQVSNQCMALVEDDLLVPVIGQPDLAYARDAAHALSETHFIPDVQYKEKDKFGNEVTKDGRPLPVEYLMVQMPAGMPKDPTYLFYTDPARVRNPFPIENRDPIAECQNAGAVFSYAQQFGDDPDECLRMMSDLHLLLYLATNRETPMDVDKQLKPLLKAIAAGDAKAVQEWVRSSDGWSSLVAVGASCPPAEAMDAVSGGGGGAQGGGAPTWSCGHCTFENVSDDASCSMCGLPR